MIIRLAACGLTVLGLLGVARGDEPAATKTELDVVYRKVGGTELKLDLVAPGETGKPRPAVLVIHGGAWRQGNKADVRPLLGRFASRGYVAVSPQYRFCPKDPFPAQIHDVKAAVRWLRTNAAKYQVDPERIGAVGFSAGGHLSLLLGLTGPGDGLDGDEGETTSSRVQAVVNYFGPSDLKASDIPDICKPWIRDFLGGSPDEKPEAAAKSSPLTFVSKDDPPILTFQGTKDNLVPFNQALKLADAMSAAGVAGRVELMVGAGHGWGGKELDRTMAETLAFLDAYLKPPAH